MKISYDEKKKVDAPTGLRKDDVVEIPKAMGVGPTLWQTWKILAVTFSVDRCVTHCPDVWGNLRKIYARASEKCWHTSAGLDVV